MEILTNLENRIKNWEIWKKYNVQSSTVSTILKRKHKIKEQHAFVQSVGSDLSRERLRDVDYDILDHIVFEWFNQRRANGELISGIILQSVAKNFHEKLVEQGLVPKNQFKKHFIFDTLTLESTKHPSTAPSVTTWITIRRTRTFLTPTTEPCGSSQNQTWRASVFPLLHSDFTLSAVEPKSRILFL